EALKRSSPLSPGVKPSQCCSNVTRRADGKPAAVNRISRMRNDPVTLPHPRPGDVMLMPGCGGGLNGQRVAFAYIPTASCEPCGAAKSSDQLSNVPVATRTLTWERSPVSEKVRVGDVKK